MDLRDAVGLGVAGNMTGHLEQAGEASDFVAVKAAAQAPKGVFPFYVPGSATFLGTYPLSSDTLALPGDGQVQLEPEVGLVCDLVWSGDHVTKVVPRALGAYDDASIRRAAPKISLKKNWGPGSKGLAAATVPVGRLEDFDRWRLTCFLRRGGALAAYGVDSEVGGYSYFHDQLLDWLVERLNHQRDEGPLEDIGALIRPGRPQRAVIAVGATRYTPFGETTWVQPGDEAIVCVYDGDAHDAAAVEAALTTGATLARASVLRRVVR